MAQTAPEQGGVPTPGNTPAAQDPARPQTQVPPDQPSQASQQRAASAEPRFLPAGANIRATMDMELSTKNAKPGDRFTATVTTPVSDSSGNVVIPTGSKLNGQVSEPTDEKLESAIKGMGHLDLRFTDVQLPDGTDVPLNATLVSLHTLRAPNANSSSASGTRALTPNSGGFGPPLKGLAVGNASGGGYVLATQGKNVQVPAQTGILLRVDRNTPLP